MKLKSKVAGKLMRVFPRVVQSSGGGSVIRRRPASSSRLLAGAAVTVLVVLLEGCSLIGPAPRAPAPEPIVAKPAEPAPSQESELDTLGLVAYAASMQGRPYVLGGDSPEVGFDCSGLVQHVFRQFRLELPRNAFVMAAELPAIGIDELRAADLVFFNTQRAPHSHVGIYLGDGRFVHAPSPRTGRVIISRMDDAYWRPRLDGARRPTPSIGVFSAAELASSPVLARAGRQPGP